MAAEATEARRARKVRVVFFITKLIVGSWEK